MAPSRASWFLVALLAATAASAESARTEPGASADVSTSSSAIGASGEAGGHPVAGLSQPMPDAPRPAFEGRVEPGVGAPTMPSVAVAPGGLAKDAVHTGAAQGVAGTEAAGGLVAKKTACQTGPPGAMRAACMTWAGTELDYGRSILGCSMGGYDEFEPGPFLACLEQMAFGTPESAIPDASMKVENQVQGVGPLDVQLAPGEDLPPLGPAGFSYSFAPTVEGLGGDPSIVPTLDLHQDVSVPDVSIPTFASAPADTLGGGMGKPDVHVEASARTGIPGPGQAGSPAPAVTASGAGSMPVPGPGGSAAGATSLGLAVTAAPGEALLPTGFAGSAWILAGSLATLAFALYHRIHSRDLLRHPIRERIFTTARERGFVTATGLANELAIHRTAVAFHLRALERERFLRQQRVGRFAAYVPIESMSPLGRAPLSPAAARVLGAVRASPAAPLGAYASELGLSVSTVHAHVRRLVASGEIVEERSEGRPHYRAAG